MFSKRFLGETSKTKETLIFIIFCKQLIQQLVKKVVLSRSLALFGWNHTKTRKKHLFPFLQKLIQQLATISVSFGFFLCFLVKQQNTPETLIFADLKAGFLGTLVWNANRKANCLEILFQHMLI